MIASATKDSMTASRFSCSTSTNAAISRTSRHRDRFGGAHQPCRERPVAGALDMGIELAVGKIVDDAAR